MEETMTPKRQREEEEIQVEVEEAGSEEYSKRHKPYNHILSLLEAEEEDPTQDLSPLITSLQQEITSSASDSETLLNSAQQDTTTTTTTTTSATAIASAAEEDDRERVMRHLLVASDDELGIPNIGEYPDGLMDFGEDGFNNGPNGFSSLCDDFWELEDETANYYTLLDSELFL